MKSGKTPQAYISLTPLEDVARPDKISGADINAICQEVGTVSTATGSGKAIIIYDRSHLRSTSFVVVSQNTVKV